MGKLFNAFYNYSKEGPGVKKTDADKKFTVVRFFKQLGNKFWQIVTLNLMTVALNFPVFFVLLGLTGNYDIRFRAPASMMYQTMYAAMGNKSPVYMALYGIFGSEMNSGYPSTTTYVLYALGLLVLLTFGISCTAIVYMMRNYTTATHVDIVGDYFRIIGKNWRQALPMGIIDIGLMFLLIYDVYFFRFNMNQSFFMQAFFWVALIIAAIYFMMRYYMYLILVTFKLSIRKIVKNSFILALVGIKRNIAATLAILLVFVINYLLFLFITPIGAALPFILTFGLCCFIATYAAYPVVKTFMIDPYYEEEDDSGLDEEEPIFVDRG